MTVECAISILALHNEWRRGANVPMANPTELGEAIDLVLSSLGDFLKMRTSVIIFDESEHFSNGNKLLGSEFLDTKLDK